MQNPNPCCCAHDLLVDKVLHVHWIPGVWILSSSDFEYSHDDDDLFKTIEILPISFFLSLSHVSYPHDLVYKILHKKQKCRISGIAVTSHSLLFQRWIRSPTQTNITWACYHAGLVYKGLHYLDSMGSACSITPTSKHWLVPAICTRQTIWSRQMSCEPTVAMWRTLLSACRTHGDVEMGAHTTNRFLQVDSGNATGCFTFIQHLCWCWLVGIQCKKWAPEKGKIWRNRQFVADGPTGRLQQMIRVQSAEIPA